MRILVGREPGAALSFTFNQWTRDIAPFLGLAIGLFDGPDNQSTHRGAGLLRPLAQFVVQRLGDIDGSSDSRGFNMSPMT
jgi:hypothetical protein